MRTERDIPRRALRPVLLWQMLIALSLAPWALACSDSDESDKNPPIIGDGDDGDGDDGDGDGTGDGDGDGPGDGDAPGDGDGLDCASEPGNPEEFLNQCAPPGVERRQFDNEQRLPPNYEPGNLPGLSG
jgi:hypothetical protein